jgi:hypothetical protein
LLEVVAALQQPPQPPQPLPPPLAVLAGPGLP